MTGDNGGSAGNRFGEIAVREGFATRAQVRECLEIQTKLRSYGVEPKKIGEILVEKGYLKPADTLAILDVQKQGASRVESRSGVGYASRVGSRQVKAATTEVAMPAGGGGAPTLQDELPTPEIPGYEILSMLGRGGMGAVYTARQKSLDRTVALKVLPPRAAKDETFIRKFISEARTVARLNHENIIAGIDVGEANGTYYFAMEHVEGESLARLIEQGGPVEEHRALEICAQMARALEHAHKHGLVHRDVKPQNILLAKNDVAKLCDLGLAKQMGQDDKGETTGIPLGTPHYLSPEQARGEADVDIRSDIYSLGATLYHMLTGVPPFEGDSPMVLMTKHLTEEPVPPRRKNEEVSKAASDLVLHMMEKDKADRPQSPTELLDEIQRVSSGKKGAHAKTSRREKRSGTTRKKRGSGTSRAVRRDDNDDSREGRAVAVRGGGSGGDNTPMIIAAIAGVVVLLVVVAMLAGGGDHPSAPDETESMKAYTKAEGLYSLALGNQSLDEGNNRSILRDKFQNIINTYPGTEGAHRAADALDRLNRPAPPPPPPPPPQHDDNH
jgi:serine/threonine-protein kinase